MSDWIVGEAARLAITVTDATGLAVDPTAVVLKVKTPSGAVSTREYPIEIERTGTGAYRCDVPLTLKGRWMWRWETDAPYQGACQGDLTVKPSNI